MAHSGHASFVSAAMHPCSVRCISSSIVKARIAPEEKQAAPQLRRCELTPWDLAPMTVHYVQKGLIFRNPTIPTIVDHLKQSLSHALTYFYPLAGRFSTEKEADFSRIFIECNNAGVEFIHAIADDVTISDVLAPVDVHPIVESFFPLNGAIGHDGHTLPLLAVQVTEMKDGVFVGCSFNHAVGDGSSFWHFFNSWAEISRSETVSRPPIFRRWFPDDVDKTRVGLPFSDPDQFLVRFSPPRLRQRYFHFTAKSIADLKSKANGERGTQRISSLQALYAHVWRSVTRARKLTEDDRATSCVFSVDARSRLVPPLSRDYFGGCILGATVTATACELLARDLGWAAWQLHLAIANMTDGVVRERYKAHVENPFILDLNKLDGRNVMIGSSPWFEMYGVDFGWGKPLGVRVGRDNITDGVVIMLAGREGDGSMELLFCLAPEVMCALETDEEFMAAVSASPPS